MVPVVSHPLTREGFTVELFASGDNSGLIGFLFIVGGIGYLGYRAYVFFYRPEQWLAEKRMKHEKEMAAAEERKAKAGRIAGGIVGGIAKAVIGAAIKGRPHH
jgi:hypothetical protein